MKVREKLQNILNDIAQELACEDVEEERTPINSYSEFIENLELEFRHELENTFKCYFKCYIKNLKMNNKE